MDAPSSITGIHHVGVSVSDLERAVAFYTGVTGLEAERRPAAPVAGWRSLVNRSDIAVATVSGPNVSIEFDELASTPADPPIPVEGPGVTHLCFQAPAEAGLYAAFVDHGATEVSREAPVDLGGYGVRYGYARDPDGTMFEVEQLDTPPFTAPVWIAHVALVSPDIDRLVDFYVRLLGIEPYRRANKVAGPRIDEVTGLHDVHVRAAWFNVGNMILELWQYVRPVTPEPARHRPFDAAGVNRFVFEVADLDTELERLTDLGVETITDPATADVEPERDVYARDPDGNVFGLLQSTTSSAGRGPRERITWM